MYLFVGLQWSGKLSRVLLLFHVLVPEGFNISVTLHKTKQEGQNDGFDGFKLVVIACTDAI